VARGVWRDESGGGEEEMGEVWGGRGDSVGGGGKKRWDGWGEKKRERTGRLKRSQKWPGRC